jgi:hypothetical protein
VLRNIAYLHAIHKLIVIDKLKKPPLTGTKQQHQPQQTPNTTTRTKANHGETTEGGINVGITGGIITVTPSIIARGPAWV